MLIMGWGGDHTAWALQAPAFAAEHRVIALDNRGAGQSDAPATPYTMSGMAADAGHLHFIEQAETFNALGLESLEKHRGA